MRTGRPTYWTPQLFWSKVAIGRKNKCWPYLNSKDKDGYGRGYDGRSKRKRPAHVIAYELHFNVSMKNFGLHTCDNPSCCNPYHIFDGTARDNILDAIKKGRLVPVGIPRKLSRMEEIRMKKMAKNDPTLSTKDLGLIFHINRRTVYTYLRRDLK